MSEQWQTAIEETLRHWVEAIRTPAIANTTFADAALFNEGCITDDLEIAAAELTSLRASQAALVEALGPEKDWREAKTELNTWCSSAFLAGEKIKDEAGHKAGLYSFLCGLLGFMESACTAAALAQSQERTSEEAK